MIKPMLVIALMASPVFAGPLEGLWESEDRSQGGIGRAISIMPDGTYEDITVVMVDSTFTYTKGRLLRVFSDDPTTPITSSVTFNGNTMRQIVSEGEDVKMERIGSPSIENSPLIGVWRYNHEAGGIAYERYTADGRNIFRLPLRITTGRYSVENNSIVFQSQSSKSAAKFELMADALLLIHGKKRTRYRREPLGVWYGNFNGDQKR